MRIGGYGPGGCTCSIYGVESCPMHGTDEHLSYDGKAAKAKREAHDLAWSDWVNQQTTSPCPTCGAAVEGLSARNTHRDWHQHIARQLRQIDAYQ